MVKGIAPLLVKNAEIRCVAKYKNGAGRFCQYKIQSNS
jgi:hypothetical protein